MNTIFLFIVALVAALLIQNLFEWFAHKYILHKIGASKTSFFHYHWEHHKRCRQNDNIDQEYVDLFERGKMSKMIKKEIFLICVSHIFIAMPTYLFVSPYLGIAGVIVAWYYYLAHALSHSNSKYKNFMPWHYDHHMGSNQNLNWCVTFPWTDWLAKTRVKAST